jgi:hypothetical protein
MAKKKEDVTKADTAGSKSVIRPLSSKEKGQPRIITSSRFIQDTAVADLVMPKRLCTFDNMARDDAVWSSIDATNVPVLLSLSGGEFVAGKSNSTLSKEAAEFLNYNIHAMSTGTWLQAMNNAGTDIKYGFSLQNIVMEKRAFGPFKGMWVLRKLAPRHQKSVHGWVWDKERREVLGFVQKPMITKIKQPTQKEFERGIIEGSSILSNMDYQYIKNEALLHFRYNPTDNDPQGDSPLMHCYDAWVEKRLVQNFEVIGVTKDMGGAYVVRVHPELLQRAASPEAYPDEAAEYAQLQKDVAALTAGESSYIILSSSADPNTKFYDYDFELKGIDGGGKQYRTSEIIDQRNKSIYNVFGASHVIIGQDGGGSYALSSNKVTIHEFFVERAAQFKIDVLNCQLAPTLLAANNIHLNYSDMPRFRPKDPSEMSLEEVGKFVQRVGSVLMLTPDMWEDIARRTGLPVEGIMDLDFTNKGESGAGESKGSSGTGDTQSGGKSSSTNSNNGGVEKSLSDKLTDSDNVIKNLTIERETDSTFVVTDMTTGAEGIINK